MYIIHRFYEQQQQQNPLHPSSSPPQQQTYQLQPPSPQQQQTYQLQSPSPQQQQQQSQTIDIIIKGKKQTLGLPNLDYIITADGIKSNGLMDIKANYDNNGGDEINGMIVMMDIDQECNDCNKGGGVKEKECDDMKKRKEINKLNDKEKGNGVRKDGTNNHYASFGNDRKEKHNLNENYQALDHRGKQKKNVTNNH